MTDRTHTVARSATFARRLADRWRPRAAAWSPPEMTLRRIEPAGARTVIQRIAPRVVSHHHAGSAVHIQLAVAGAAPERSAERPRGGSAPPSPAATTTVVVTPVERLVRAAAATPVVAAPAATVVLRPATLLPAHIAPSRPGPASDGVRAAMTVRREEHVRVETVVRRTRTELAAPMASPGSPSVAAAPGRSAGDAAPSGQGPRRSSTRASGQPVGLAEVEITRLADRVVERIQRRATVQRERMGGR